MISFKFYFNGNQIVVYLNWITAIVVHEKILFDKVCQKLFFFYQKEYQIFITNLLENKNNYQLLLFIQCPLTYLSIKKKKVFLKKNVLERLFTNFVQLEYQG